MAYEDNRYALTASITVMGDTVDDSRVYPHARVINNTAHTTFTLRRYDDVIVFVNRQGDEVFRVLVKQHDVGHVNIDVWTEPGEEVFVNVT